MKRTPSGSQGMKRPKKPTLPKKKDGYACPDCGGRKYYYKPEDRDPIEGYKLAPRYRCGLCKATGVVDLKTYKYHARWQDKLHRYEVNLKKYKKVKEIATAALKKLTSKEKNALKTWWRAIG